MNYRHTLITNAVETLTKFGHANHPEVRGIIHELSTGHYTPDTLPSEKFNVLNLASEALKDRRLVLQNSKAKTKKKAS